MSLLRILMVASLVTPALAGNDKPLPPLPEAVTSFGAAALGDHVYAYGGHSGSAHHYSTAHHGYAFVRLRYPGGSAWETLPFDVPAQGFGFVAHGQHLYRLGGSQAQNAPDEDERLISLASVARFDTRAGAWQPATPLPEPRSSFHAAVVDHHVYVAGGWLMPADGGDKTWLKTAWRADLRRWPLTWEALPDLPAPRRAHAAAAAGGRLILLGGMHPPGATSSAVTIFDPRTGAWRDGAEYPGTGDMKGFGLAACVRNGELLASGFDGGLHRYDVSSDRWTTTKLKPSEPRFFHCLVACGQDVLSLGGATRGGHVATVERLKPAPVEEAARGSDG